MNIKVIVCPHGRCEWFWRYDADDRFSKDRAKAEERAHWDEFHEVSG